MSEMFWDATAFNGNISTWDVSSVTDMYVMFYNATTNPCLGHLIDDLYARHVPTSFNQPLDTWDVSSVTGMQ